MAFDASIEKIKCITEHEDYAAISNKAVLLQVAPLLKNKNGRPYRRRAGIAENEWVVLYKHVYTLAHGIFVGLGIYSPISKGGRSKKKQ